MTTAPDPRSLATDTLHAAVMAGTRFSGGDTRRAAMHLLTFTDLLSRADVAPYIHLRYETDRDGLEVLVAHVDLDALAEDKGIPLTGGDERFLTLARSYASGEPVVLGDFLNTLGHAHARRAIEAYIISLGMEGWYQVQEGPELAAHRRFEATLLGNTTEA
ncbi:hypothetical protein ACIRYZ_38970 [Kitasatospora sp. NPDC101155]|uniref:hypothetical protein n=1 Tax=Kitasatospora sp. NPDC101155 TaxID=3364097 RepID=UPI00380C4691